MFKYSYGGLILFKLSNKVEVGGKNGSCFLFLLSLLLFFELYRKPPFHSLLQRQWLCRVSCVVARGTRGLAVYQLHPTCIAPSACCRSRAGLTDDDNNEPGNKKHPRPPRKSPTAQHKHSFKVLRIFSINPPLQRYQLNLQAFFVPVCLMCQSRPRFSNNCMFGAENTLSFMHT